MKSKKEPIEVEAKPKTSKTTTYVSTAGALPKENPFLNAFLFFGGLIGGLGIPFIFVFLCCFVLMFCSSASMFFEALGNYPGILLF